MRSVCSATCESTLLRKEESRRMGNSARYIVRSIQKKELNKAREVVRQLHKKKKETKALTDSQSNGLKLSKKNQAKLARLQARQLKEFNSSRQKAIDKLLGKSPSQSTKALEKENKKLKDEIKALKESKPVNGFYDSRAWRELRYRVIQVYGRKCMCCNSTNGIMHVDHIKPRSKYPELELDFNNLQVLCKDCNLGKSNLDETDWRPKCEF